jgi:hypothetical protein
MAKVYLFGKEIHGGVGRKVKPMAEQTEFSNALLELVALRLKERSCVYFLKSIVKEMNENACV